METYLLSVLADNNRGVLLRVSGLFSRRGYSIQSISAAQTENPQISRMTIVVAATEDTLEQIVKQLNKLVDIKDVRVLRRREAVCREHLLVKAAYDQSTKLSLIKLANHYKAHIVDIAGDNLMLELTGEPGTITEFIGKLEKFGIKKLVKTGISALERG